MGDHGMDSETLRYSRQVILDGIGWDGQKRLEKARVLVAGAGGLGSPVLLYLAAAGVGTLGIADFDSVTYSNLNRQIIHFSDDLGRPKTESARAKINRQNPGVNVVVHDEGLNAENVSEIITGYDIIIDATDNITSRYLISDSCYFLKKPLVEGAAVGYDGILMTVIPDKSPCYRCLYPAPPEDGVLPTCGDTGILGMNAGIIGTMQALEAVKLILGIGETVSGRILAFNALTTGFQEIRLSKKRDCPLCGENPTILELVEYQIHCKTKIIDG